MLPFADVNVLAAVAVTIAAMIVGMIWYGPLFGEEWMKLVGLTKKDGQKDMAKTMITGLIITFITAFSLGMVLRLVGPADLKDGMMVGLLLWFGFIVMNEASSAVWARGPWKLVWINAGYSLIITLITVYIMMSWPA